MIKEVHTGYNPRPGQAAMHAKLKRFNVIVCHRRWGKTVFSINHLVDRAFRSPYKNPQYAYLAPTYSQAKMVAWQYLQQYTENLPRDVNESDLRVDLYAGDGKKIRIRLLSADNPDSMRGLYLDGVVLDEFAMMNPMVWGQVIRPALADRLGFAIFIFTPSGMNHAYDMLEYAKNNDEWFWEVIPASKSGVLPQSELTAMADEMSEENYQQELECSFSAALVGAYFGKQMELAESENRVTSVPYEPSVPVETAFDLGVDDATAIWFFQQHRKEIRVIDYLEDSGTSIEMWANRLRQKEYSFLEHYMPHDIAVREMGTGVSRLEVFRKHGIKPIRIVPKQNPMDRINAARLLLRRCWFDKNKCERGIAALKNYQKKYDEKAKRYSDNPLRNWATHGADAFGTYAMGMIEASRRSDSTNLPTQSDTSYNPFETPKESDYMPRKDRW